MKLYTEEQVRIAYSKGKNDGLTGFMRDFEQLNLLPIELPSDEKMDKFLLDNSYEYGYGYRDAIDWIKKQILNQNK